MKFDGPLMEEFSGSRKLPTEVKLREYIDQFKIADPYTPFEAMTFDKEILYSLKALSRPRVISIHNMWIGASFTDSTVKANLVDKPDNQETTHLPTAHHSFPMKWSNNFAQDYTKTSGSFKSWTQSTLTQSKQIHSFMNTQSNYMEKYKMAQRNIFIQGMKIAGYLKNRSEFELMKEFKLRQTQFPGEQVYILLGQSVSDYMDTIYLKENFATSIMLKYPSNSVRNWRTNLWSVQIENYESAVFVKSQIHTAQDFIFDYDIQRLDRRWAISYGSICKFTLSIDQAIQDNKVIIPNGLSQFNFEQ